MQRLQPKRSVFPSGDGIDQQLAHAQALAAGIQRCRDLGDLPPNICTPIYLEETARAIAEQHDSLSVEVLDEQQMEALNMNALLAVGKASVNPPRLIRLSWRGGKDSDAPLALVGKGITFDTGGISIKPRDLMEQMKFDMCGAAATIGVLEAIANLKLPINVDGVVAAAENMLDGKAYRPGDIITAMNGKTIEVHNTDAEGRMVLADALYWTGQNIKPRIMVDMATLTGACVVALGHHASAVMTQDDELAAELLDAGNAAADPRLASAAVGRLPGADRNPVCRHEECRRHASRLDHRRLLSVALHRWPSLGSYRHRRLRLALGQTRKRLRPPGRHARRMARQPRRRLGWVLIESLFRVGRPDVADGPYCRILPTPEPLQIDEQSLRNK